MDTLPMLCLARIAEQLCDDYGVLGISRERFDLVDVARDAGSFARVSRWFRESFALPLYEYIDAGCLMDCQAPEAQLAGHTKLGCPVRPLVRAGMLVEAKEPWARVTASKALSMGIHPEMLDHLTNDVEMGFPLIELDFAPSYYSNLADDIGPEDWAEFQATCDPLYPAPTRMFFKLDVLEVLADLMQGRPGSYRRRAF